MYIPPFHTSPKTINTIAEISAQMERYAIRLEQEDGLRLRKANRIKTIHSSLAIEGNSLSEKEVADIIDGKNVVAPIKQIQEVKNAIATYNMYADLNPFDVNDLLRAHGVMMQALTDDAGRFRHAGVGVFSETGLVHLAPPADRVPTLIADLFEWLRSADDHLLIRSCVFHYEFEFIHPFSDGNGRTGRLWQSLILGRLHPLFEHLPVENLVFNNQQAYYDAITLSTKEGQCGAFIDFMLGEILKTLKEHQGEEQLSTIEFVPIKAQNIFPNKIPIIFPNNFRNRYPSVTNVVWYIGSLLYNSPGATAEKIGEALGLSGRMVRTHIATLRNLGIAERIGSNKTGYWKIKIVD